MAGKKKGSSNRLAKMSDEERARYLQHRAAIEEEAKRRKEQLISTYMKNKIKREEAFTRLNIAKINEHWHQTLRKIKVKQLKAEVTDLSAWIRETLEVKNSTIKTLLQQLNEAEEQYQHNFKNHCSTLDYFLEIYYCQKQELHEDYEKTRDLIVEQGTKYMESMKKEWDEEESYLRTVVFATEYKAEKELKEKKAIKQAKLDDFMDTCRAERETMESSYHDAMDKIWKDINSTLCEYLSTTTTRRHHYIELKHLDDRNTAQRLHNEKLIKKYTKLIEKMKKDEELLHDEHEYDIQRSTEIYENLSKQLSTMKRNLTGNIRKDEKRLQFMTVESKSCIKPFEKMQEKYQNIQKLLMCCNKLETENDEIRFNEKLEEFKKYWEGKQVCIEDREDSRSDDKEESENNGQEESESTEKEAVQSAAKEELESDGKQASESSEKEEKVEEVADNAIVRRRPVSGLSSGSRFSITKDFEMMDKLDLLVWRCNIIEYDSLRLKNEKAKFLMENENLKKIIKGVLNDMSAVPTNPPKDTVISDKIISVPMKLTRKYSAGSSSQPSFIVVDL